MSFSTTINLNLLLLILFYFILINYAVIKSKFLVDDLTDPSIISFNFRYKRYVKIGKRSTPNASDTNRPYNQRSFLRSVPLQPLSDYGDDSFKKVTPPVVSAKSVAIYKRYINTPTEACNGPSFKDFNIFSKYVNYGS